MINVEQIAENVEEYYCILEILSSLAKYQDLLDENGFDYDEQINKINNILNSMFDYFNRDNL